MTCHSIRLTLIGLFSIILNCGIGNSQPPDATEKTPKSLGGLEARDLLRTWKLIWEGDMAEYLGDKEKALRIFREAAGIYQQAAIRSPEDAGIRRKLGYYLLLGDQKGEAIVAFNEAIQLQPHDAESQWMLDLINKFPILKIVRIPEYNEPTARIIEKEEDLTRKLIYWINKVDDWRTAVDRHIPGTPDAYATFVGNFPQGDLEAIVELVKITAKSAKQVQDMKAKGLKKAEDPSEPAKNATQAQGRGVSEDNKERMAASVERDIRSREKEADRKWSEQLFRKLPPAVARALLLSKEIAPFLRATDGPNPILKRGALLHSDIAMLQLETARAEGSGSPMVLGKDGLGTLQSGGWNWKCARLLLDLVYPDPSFDELVNKWYIATTAYMFARHDWGCAEFNLLSAMRIFPNDASILFYAGVLHEIYAAPISQNALPPSSVGFSFGSKKKELELAQKYFERAVDEDPEFAEASLHLGRVMGLLGDHNPAVAELQKSAATLKDPHLVYYCSLFLGNELAILNRREEAQSQFERAAALFPNAQSPLLALSRLARKSGDFRKASLTVQQVFTLPADNSFTQDPWWIYDLSHVRNEPELQSEMRKAFGGILQ